MFILRYCSLAAVSDQVVDTGVAFGSLLSHHQVTTGAPQ